MPSTRLKRSPMGLSKSSQQINGLYMHSSPPKVLQIHPSVIRQWLRAGDLSQLDQVVLDGQGHKLLGEYSPDPKVRSFLKQVPAYMLKINKLHEAVGKGDLKQLQKLMDPKNLESSMKNIYLCKNYAGVSLLQKAAYYGFPKIVEFLVTNYPQIVNMKDREGKTALHYCGASKEAGKIWPVLVNAGADLKATDSRGRLPSYYMERSGELQLPDTKILTELPNTSSSGRNGLVIRPSNIRIWIHDRDFNKLQQVIWEGHGGKLKVETSGNPKVRRFLEGVPYVLNAIKDVHSAVISGDLDDFVKRTSDPVPMDILGSKDSNGLNALHKAAGLDRRDIAENILNRNPNLVSSSDAEGKTPLHFAAALKDPTMYNLLKSHNADEMTLDKNGKAPSYYRTNAKEIPAKLLEVVPEAPRTSTAFPPNWDWMLLHPEGIPQSIPNINIKEAEGVTENNSTNDAKEQEEKDEPQLVELVVDEVGSTGKEEEENPKSPEDSGSEKSEKEVKEPEKEEETPEENVSEGQKAEEEIPNGEASTEPMPNGEESPNDKNEAVEQEEVSDVEEEGSDQINVSENTGNFDIWTNENAEDNNLKEDEMEDERQERDEEETEQPTEEKTDDEDETKIPINFSEEPEVLNESVSNEEKAAEEERRQKTEREIAEERQRLLDEGLLKVNSSEEEELSEEEKLKEIIESGDLEKLASMVLDGEGHKLQGKTSKNSEVQSFLDNLPSYMNKIKGVHKAARSGSLRDLQTVLDRRRFAVAKEASDKLGATPLHVAVLFGKSQIVKYLGGRFPETLHAKDKSGRTPLHYAAILPDNGYFSNTLLNLGADEKEEDNEGHTATYYQENPGELTQEKLLEEYDAPAQIATDMLTDQAHPLFGSEDGKYLANALGGPLVRGLTEIAHKRPRNPIAYLANFLYDFLNKNKGVSSPVTDPSMHSAEPEPSFDEGIPLGKAKTAEDADEGNNASESPRSSFTATDRDEYGQSVLHFAAARAHGRSGLFQLIQESSVNLGYRDELYRTARDIALQANIPENVNEIDKYVISLAARGETEKIIEIFLEGYDHILDLEDDENSDILTVATNKNQEKTITFLKAMPAFEEKRERVHRAIRAGEEATVKDILAESKNGRFLVIGKNTTGRCSLHIAVLSQQKEITEFIAQKFPESLRIGDNLERTALHYAMGVDDVETLSKILIKCGAKRVLKDLKGRQPTYYFMNKSEILKLQEEENMLKV